MCLLKWMFLFLTTVFVKASSKGEILLVSHNHGILRLDVDNHVNTTKVRADRPVVTFDIHLAWKQIYWATETTIYRTPLYDLETATPLALVGRVGSLVVDWVHHHLYWTDLDQGGRLEAALLDGTGRRVVHRVENGTNLGAMVVDPLLGKLFWIEWSNTSNSNRIVSCNLDGSSKRTFYESENISRHSPLAIDVTYSGIYFYKVINNGSELWNANYQIPHEAIRLFERPGKPPKSLSLAKDGFYFSNINGTYSCKWVKRKYTIVYGNRTDHIFSLDPYFRLVGPNLKHSSQIRVVSEVVQPQWPNLCAYHQCEHDCVVISHRHHKHHHQPADHQRNTTCVCRYGYTLRDDGRTCKEQGYLLYSSGTTFGRITIKGDDNTLLYNDSSSNIQTFDVDVQSEYVYWSDLFAQAIYRAPAEQMARKEVVVAGVTAFGVAVDWLHSNIYWTDESRIMAAPVHGGEPVLILDGQDSPANIAVDPFNKYIFWVECGSLMIIRRADLTGDDVTDLVTSDVTCGMSLTADHETNTLFILDWAGAVSLCRYDGSGHTKLFSDVVRGLTIMDHQPLWTLIEDNDDPENTFFRDKLNVLAQNLEPSMIKMVKRSHQPDGVNVCADVECRGVCLAKNGTVSCMCGGDNNVAACSRKHGKIKGPGPNDYLKVVEVTPFSVVLQCSGPLMKHNKMRPWVRVEEIDSLVHRDKALRWKDYVRIANQSLPFTVDGLNPATTYHFTVQHGVTRASRHIVVHTPPPPLTVRRLPIISVPGIPGNIPWEPQGVHYEITNPWEQLVKRKYFLLLLSHNSYTQANPPPVPQDILDVLKRRIKRSFMVIKMYKSEEEFDDDPEMYLANVVWGETFQGTMVQTTEYRGSYNLDLVKTRSFALPDPYWRPFVDRLLETHELVGSVERL
ncbi:low-density lipoprotein receptor-related protein 4-like [Macrosteles quadrilineatus]|uniref:low-density lipoprotein receptor-related protein 4-like n=1 Tax=Macrosteles quadrilineatus TaxID=74068 RepID=UPI0023E1A2F6|nr:low-density lipoprotein receptor-related protein 4-like [Macrosteles quadrilineatus]